MKELVQELALLIERISVAKLFEYIKRFSDYIAILTRIAFLSLITGYLIAKTRDSSGAWSYALMFAQGISAALGLALTIAFGLLSHKISQSVYEYLSEASGQVKYKMIGKTISVFFFFLMIGAGIAINISATRFGAEQAMEIN